MNFWDDFVDFMADLFAIFGLGALLWLVFYFA